MAKITVDTEILATRDRVWSVLADLEAIERFHPWVTDVELTTEARTGIGAGRKVSMRDGKNWLNERIVAWEDGRRHVVEVVGTSYPLATSIVTTELVDAEGATHVRVTAEYRVKFGPIGKLLDALFVRRIFGRIFNDSLAGLKHHIQTGAKVATSLPQS